MKIIIDTNVLIDMMLTDRPRHSQAQGLRKYIETNSAGLLLLIPMHQLFEFTLTFRNEETQRKIAGRGPEIALAWTTPVPYMPVSIDLNFFFQYYDPTLPYIRAADYIFVTLAKKEEAIFISEDDKTVKKAKSAGVKAYQITEFLKEFAEGGDLQS